MKGFSTKYALTKGISAVEVSRSEHDSQYLYTTGRYSIQLIDGTTFFATLEDAWANAIEQAERKRRSLAKADAKLARLIDAWRDGKAGAR